MTMSSSSLPSSTSLKCFVCGHKTHSAACPSCACIHTPKKSIIDDKDRDEYEIVDNKLVCLGHSKEFSEFCTRCKTLCCKTCSSQLHSTCTKYLLPIDVAASEIHKELLSHKIDLEDFKSRIVKCMLNISDIKQLKDKQKDDVLKAYDDIFDMIVKAIESKKQQLLQVIRNDSDNTKSAKDLELRCNRELKYISEQMDLVDNSLEGQENKEIFFNRYSKCNVSRDLKTVLQEIENIMSDSSVYQLSQKKSKVFDLLLLELVSKLCPSEVYCNMSKETIKEQLLSLVTYLKPQRIFKFSTNTEDERVSKKYLNDMVVFNDGCIVLTDSFNNKLKLFSCSGHLISECILEYWPFGVCIWDDDMFVVSLPNVRKICFIKHLCPMSVSHYIVTKWSYYCLTKVDNGHLVCTHCLTSKVDIVRVNNNSLTLIRTIEPDILGEIANSVCYVTITPAGDIVISDHLNDCIICYGLDGSYKFTVKYIGKYPLDGPAGVCVDERFIYLSEMGQSRILRLTFSGTLSGVLVPKERNLIRPKAISIGPKRTIAVSNFTRQQSFIQVFQI
ncbi:uncharacterized protein LOC106869151 [Octopus bimaculoides]|uniref:B box-type domain-containing protein n=1 Tax=Octopus bimaculoides TaxID=37653 RepID=A0A0L8HR20_OCTBM|nr:uncharacterized protein LOC106869151 [Octopus bimaculoides]|eukprot:XP_014770242.1 PREDICTED: uncharacterized protein LOC106869151 [Octopus bimaculoides]